MIEAVIGWEPGSRTGLLHGFARSGSGDGCVNAIAEGSEILLESLKAAGAGTA
jgi:hypothetical protein